MESYSLQKIGVSKAGGPRFYKQGKRLGLAGFAPGARFESHIFRERGMLILKISSTGTRLVSHKQTSTEQCVPVIDITSRDELSIFDGMDTIRVIVKDGVIYLMALAAEVRRQDRVERLKSKLSTGEPLDVGSISHGVGVLCDALKEGMELAGLKANLRIANDIDPDYLSHSQTIPGQWNDRTIELAAPLQVVAFDEWTAQHLPKLDVLSAGLPCTAASLAGRAKKGLTLPECDPNVGHLVVPFLQLIFRLNPSVAILENVPLWAETASMAILLSTLTDWQYVVHHRILAGGDFGALENRKRLCVVAVTKGMDFDFDNIEIPTLVQQRVGDILDNVPEDDPSWSEMSYLRDKETRDIDAGKGFRMQTIGPDDTSIGTIGRGYNKRRSTEPFLRHPTKDGFLRLLTPSEHGRVKQVDPRFIKGLCATTAHQVLGQGICFAPFVAVGKLIGNAVKAFHALPDVSATKRAPETLSHDSPHLQTLPLFAA